MKINPDDPWYPDPHYESDHHGGVSIRLKLAAMAMQTFLHDMKADADDSTAPIFSDIAVWSFVMADAMIERANRDEGKQQ